MKKSPPPRYALRALSIAEIESLAENYKEDLQRDANRHIRQGRTERAMAALDGIETINHFVYQLTIAVGSQLHAPKDRTRGKKPEIPTAVRRYARRLPNAQETPELGG